MVIRGTCFGNEFSSTIECCKSFDNLAMTTEATTDQMSLFHDFDILNQEIPSDEESATFNDVPDQANEVSQTNLISGIEVASSVHQGAPKEESIPLPEADSSEDVFYNQGG